MARICAQNALIKYPQTKAFIRPWAKQIKLNLGTKYMTSLSKSQITDSTVNYFPYVLGSNLSQLFQKIQTTSKFKFYLSDARLPIVVWLAIIELSPILKHNQSSVDLFIISIFLWSIFPHTYRERWLIMLFYPISWYF